MEKIIQMLINNWTKGVDTYTHNASTWLIFTDSKRWVIELTEDKTLWYNYNFFKQIFEFTSLDVVENQYLITKWVEDNVINKINNIRFRDARDNKHQFEDTLKNGVKDTRLEINITEGEVDDIIQDGVKETNHVDVMNFFDNKMEDTLNNGVKETNYDTDNYTDDVKEVIREGVKETSHRQYLKTYDVKDTTQDGTEHDRWILDGCYDPVDVVLDNGVKITTPLQSREYTGDIDEVLGNGIKSSIPRQYVGGDIIDKVIDKGVIETHREICEYKHTVEHIIQTGVKETNPVDVMKFFDNKMEDVLQNGIKETKYCSPGINEFFLESVIKNGVIETHEDVYHHKGRIDGVIKNGVKEVISYDEHKREPVNTFGYIDDIIKEGEKINGTYAGGQRQSEKCKSVVEYGTKNPSV